MQRDKKIKLGKGITALLLSIVLLVTSVPFTLAAGPGTYDPIPTFNDVKAREVSASINADGGISVSFPEATVSVLKKEKKISGYMLELVDLGTYTSLHTDTVILRKIVKPTGRPPYSAEITKAEIEQKLSTGLLEDHRYNVSVVAFDSEGWFSEPVNAYVSDVPIFIYDESEYAPVTSNAYAAREILTFESKSEDDNHGKYSTYGITERTQTDNNTRGKSASFDFMQEGDHLTYGGSTNGVGAKKYTYDASGNLTDYSKTKGYAMRIESAPTEAVPQVFDVAWSRQTWDPAGASEVWFYVDFSQVSVTGLSFRLRSNDKWFAQDYDNKDYTDSKNAFNRYGDIIYSTVGAAIGRSKGLIKEDPYLYLQQADGGWKKVLLSADGTIDLDHFCGYVSIPLKFMCSETDAVVTESNTEFGISEPQIDGQKIYKIGDHSGTIQRADKYYNDIIKLSKPVVVDPAGTSIADALLVRHYSFTTGLPFKINFPTRYYIDGGLMLAPCMDVSEGNKTAADLPKRAYIDKSKIGEVDENGRSKAVVNRENGYKAIEDIMSAGFKFTGCTADSTDSTLETSQNSIGKKIFLDNVLFYRTDGQEYSTNTLNGSASTGLPVKNYYDQETEIPRAIFNACQKYIKSPDSYDYRAVKYIEDLINGYKQSIEDYNKSEEAAKCGTIDASFLEDANLDEKAAALAMTEVWEKYKAAMQACMEEGTYGSVNSGANDFIPIIAKKLEQLPDFDENTLTVSDEDKAVVKSIYDIYIRLNLSQLTMLGKAEEEKLLKYFKFIEEELADNSVIIGQALTNNKVIPFGDFNSLEKGTRSWQFENSKYAGQVGKDYYYSKGYLTYQAPFAALSAHSEDTATPTLIPTGAFGSDPQRNGITSYRQNGTSAIITSNGLEGNNAATVTINNQYAEDRTGWYNCISITKGLVDKEPSSSGDYSALRANNMSSESLGDFAKTYKKNEIGETDRLALVFYADFSQLDTFTMALNISSYYEGKAEDYTLDIGSDKGASYFYLINPKTGEWAKCTSKDEDKRRIYAYTSEYGIDTGDGDYLTLSHYKGYVMVPLFQFARGVQKVNAFSNYRIDEKAESLNNIFRVTIGIAPLSDYNDSSVNGKSAAAMNGKSFTIGSVGFTYRQGTPVYGEVIQNRTGDVSFDDYTQVKSLTSMQFENAVADIDIYKENTRTEKINTALALYAQLSEYQKTIPSVARAYSVLQNYKNIDDGVTPIDPSKIAVADLKPLIEAMPTAATGGSVTGSNTLPYPGFVIGTDENGAKKPLVNYGAYNLTAADVQNIIDWYELSYKRYTDEEIAELGTDDVAKMENLYKVAKRLRLLEEYRDGYTSDSGTAITGIKDLNTFLASMYGETGKATDLTTDLRLMPTNQTAALENYIEKYNNLDYYAKYILTDKADNFASAPQYKNFAKSAEAVNKVLANIKTYTDDITGETVKGGIVQLEEKYTELYNTVKGKMDSNAIQNLTKITEAVEEYNSFKNYVKQIQEVNDGNTVNSSDGEALHGIIDTLRLFPRYTADTTDKTIYLSKDKLSETDTYSVTYSEQLPSATPVNTQINLTSVNGQLKNALGENAAYDVKVTVNGSTKTYSAADLTAGVKLSDVANNTLTPGAPLTVNVEVSVPAELAVANAISDKLVFTYTDDAGTVLKDSTGKELKKTLDVIYTPNDAYTVTIPAEFNVAWDDSTDQSVDCKVSTSLKAGAKLNVAVTCDGTPDSAGAYTGAGQLTSSNPSFNLTYNYKGFDPSDFTGINTDVGLNTTPYLSVSGWDAVPVGEYKTTLTYTVTYTDATP